MDTDKLIERGDLHNRSRIPPWLKRNILTAEKVGAVKRVLRNKKVSTVCEEARCPNIAECFGKKRATFIILGEVCTRSCGFCSIKAGSPLPPDPGEPENIAAACLSLGLNYAVITSVTRDDLGDGGAGHFARVISEVKRTNPDIRVEVLTPDFAGDPGAVDMVCLSAPHIYNHNVETVPSLYSRVRPEADYRQSIKLLGYVKKKYPDILTKSGIMLGLGETRVSRDSLKSGFLQRHVVIGIEIIQADHGLATLQKAERDEITNEAGAAGDQNLHAPNLMFTRIPLSGAGFAVEMRALGTHFAGGMQFEIWRHN